MSDGALAGHTTTVIDIGDEALDRARLDRDVEKGRRTRDDVERGELGRKTGKGSYTYGGSADGKPS